MRPFSAIRHLLLLALVAASLSAWAGEFDDAFFKRSYVGTIGGKHAFDMELRKAGGILRGAYRYAGARSALTLEGKLAADGTFMLLETSGDKLTGTVKGRLVAEKISAVWATPWNAKRKRQLDFNAVQTAQADLHDKAAVLRGAQGTYSLKTISGSIGSQPQYDTWRERGAWRSTTWSISTGRRVDDYASLTRADRALLDSMQVSVDAALTVRFSAAGKVLLEIPFAQGPDYRVRESNIP